MSSCKRCGEPAVTVSRAEPFCEACFTKFVQFRHRKALERFKVDYSQPPPPDQHVLLALSLGTASIALLDMCAALIQAQKGIHRGRQGFYLHAAFIHERWEGDEVFDKDATSKLQEVKEAYPDLDSLDVVQLDRDAVTAGISSMNRTSRQDCMHLIRLKTINTIAEKRHCQTVIFGHSQTRLAELVLALTAKGRGNLVASAIEEPEYPLQEVLFTELQTYNELRGLGKFVLVAEKVPGTTKLQSVDELVRQYFRSVEPDFPSVVSTVLRTAQKLGPSPASDELCSVCQNPIEQHDPQQWLSRITENPPHSTEVIAPGPTCYGCLIMLRGTTGSPVRPSVKSILSEYEL